MDIVTCYVAMETFVGVTQQDLAFAVSLILQSLVWNMRANQAEIYCNKYAIEGAFIVFQRCKRKHLWAQHYSTWHLL